MKRARIMSAGAARGAVCAGIVVGLMAMCACSSNSDTSDPTTRALNDPMNYKPAVDNGSVTGGGISDFDQKEFQKDVDHAVNP